jgi:hypothetical protein
MDQLRQLAGAAPCKFNEANVGAARGMLLGRLQWRWRGKRFRDNSSDIISLAEERDRILALVNNLIG